MTQGCPATARAVALAGPCGAGKTQLLEAMLYATGALSRPGSAAARDRVGDASPEARERALSTEAAVAALDFLGERYWVFDTPGSPEFFQDAETAILAADVTVVVCEPDPARAAQVQTTLRRLDDLGAPYMLFVNKMDEATGRVRDLLAALQDVAERPLVMRQIPIREGGAVTGYVDLALERAYVYRPGEPSRQIPIPSDLADREADARFQMLERLADYDDALMEALLEERAPEPARVFGDLADDLRAGVIAPVFLGSAKTSGGVRRLLKALRHEAPRVEATAARLAPGGAEAETAVYVTKSLHAGAAGALAVGRVLAGSLAEGQTLLRPDGASGRVGALSALRGDALTRAPAPITGDVVAIARFGGARAGELLVGSGPARAAAVTPAPATPVYARVVSAAGSKDEVKLGPAIGKLVEEDPSLLFAPDADTGAFILGGAGEAHLAVARARAARKFSVDLAFAPPPTPYRETLKGPASHRGRHKKQSGGHGQFAAVALTVRPGPRGSGFVFEDEITGGAIPRQYIPAVEAGVRDAMAKGPLGFPVVDVIVAAVDGAAHAVDSSEMAFRTAGRIVMEAAMIAAGSILLEPVMAVDLDGPSEALSKLTALVSGRRGQILGFDARPGWKGWDRLSAYIPGAEMDGLIADLRAVTAGVGTFTARLDHLAELHGRHAERIVKEAAMA